MEPILFRSGKIEVFFRKLSGGIPDLISAENRFAEIPVAERIPWTGYGLKIGQAGPPHIFCRLRIAGRDCEISGAGSAAVYRELLPADIFRNGF